jgi:putative membrane protein
LGGIVLGIIVLALVIRFLLEKFPVPTTACFIGLVLGGVPVLYNKIKDEKLKWTHIVSFIITLAVIIVPAVIAVSTPAVTAMEMNFVNIVILVMLGVISAAAMVVPGVSGSMILMMLGYYNFVMSTIKNTVSTAVHFEFSEFFSNALIMIPFALGVLLGIVVISKIIAFVLKRWPNASTWGILGLVVASPFAIIVKIGAVVLTPLTIIASLATFAIGYLISSKLGEK